LQEAPRHTGTLEQEPVLKTCPYRKISSDWLKHNNTVAGYPAVLINMQSVAVSGEAVSVLRI